MGLESANVLNAVEFAVILGVLPMPRTALRMIPAVILLALIVGFAAPAAHAETAKGYVFDDRDGDGQRGPGEDGIAGVYVSNSVEVVATNNDGYYELPVEGDTSLFVIKPTGWRTGVSEYNLPRFYYIHKPEGSPESKHPGLPATGPLPDYINFGLQRQEEPDEFRVIFFGDPQQSGDRRRGGGGGSEEVSTVFLHPRILFGQSLGTAAGRPAPDDSNSAAPAEQSLKRRAFP